MKKNREQWNQHLLKHSRYNHSPVVKMRQMTPPMMLTAAVGGQTALMLLVSI